MNRFRILIPLITLSIFGVSCSGKYTVKSYPPKAKVYIRNLESQDKKLMGVSPIKIDEESELGDVFFLVFEKENYKEKEVMVKVNEGESLTIATRLEPLLITDEGKGLAKKDDENKPPQPGKPPEKKKKDDDKLKKEMEDVKLRVALLENTVTFYKDAMFSSRFQGGMAKFDRDKSDDIVDKLFKAQKLISVKNYKLAMKNINSVIKNDEYNANAWLLKGSTYYLMGSYSLAKRAWERCLQINPHDKIAYRYLNKVYAKIGVKKMPGKPAVLRYPASQVEIEKRNR